MPKSDNELFTDEQWKRLYRNVTFEVRAKYPGAGHHDLEDAVQAAVAGVWTTWQNYPSSRALEDNLSRIALATRWAILRAKEYLAGAVDWSRSESHFDEEQDIEQTEEWWRAQADGGPTPEELMLLRERAEEIRRACAALGEEDLEGWLIPVMEGEGIREQARREGRHPTTVYERRERGSRRLRGLLEVA